MSAPVRVCKGACVWACPLRTALARFGAGGLGAGAKGSAGGAWPRPAVATALRSAAFCAAPPIPTAAFPLWSVRAGAAVAITSNNFNDVVVWSPWTSMPDCYRNFVCVENAQFSSAVKLGPGEFWRSQAEWGVKDL